MWPILIALTLAFPFLYKYSFIITNQYSQIPIILSFIDPNYLTGDWYVSINKQFGPRTIFAFYMAQIAKIIGLPAAFLLNYLFYIFAISLSCYKLTYLLFKNKFIALLTTISILFGTSFTLGGNIFITADFTAPQLPLSLTLLATTFLLEKKYLYSACLFSLSGILHPLLGFEPAIVLFFAVSVSLVSLGKSIKKLFTYGILPFFLFFLPVFYLYLTEGIKDQVEATDKIEILAFMRNAHHYVSSLFPWWHYISFILLLIIFFLIIHIIKKKIDAYIERSVLLAVFSILLLCLVGAIGTEIFPFYPIVLLQTFRLTLFVYFFAAVAIFGGIYYLVDQKKLAPMLIFIPIFLTNPSFFLSVSKINIIAAIVGFLLIAFYKSTPRYIFALLLIGFFSLSRFHQKANFSSYIASPSDESKVTQWAKKNTPQEAIFLVPPEFESFRLLSNRAIVADWKAFPFQQKAMVDWAKRMCDIGNISNCRYKNVSRDGVISGFRTLDEQAILTLAKKYNFTYLVSDQDYRGFEKIYSNSFSVYKIDTATEIYQ